jgi:hypothetical protein
MTDTNAATDGRGRQVEKPENAGSNPALRTIPNFFNGFIRFQASKNRKS